MSSKNTIEISDAILEDSVGMTFIIDQGFVLSNPVKTKNGSTIFDLKINAIEDTGFETQMNKILEYFELHKYDTNPNT